MTQPPTAELDPRYSSADAVAVPWSETERVLRESGLYWISTVRLDGRPHVTPLVGVWDEEAMYFTTGAAERKALNIENNPKCVLTTGNNDWDRGLDVVVEGTAMRVQDEDALRRVADAYRDKYGQAWSFDVSGASFVNRGMASIVFEVVPVTVFSFGKGPFSQTRYVFDTRAGDTRDR